MLNIQPGSLAMLILTSALRNYVEIKKPKPICSIYMYYIYLKGGWHDKTKKNLL